MNETEEEYELSTSAEARAAGLRRLPRRRVEEHSNDEKFITALAERLREHPTEKDA